MVFISRALLHRCPSEVTDLVRAALLFNFSQTLAPEGSYLMVQGKENEHSLLVSAFLPISPEPFPRWGLVHSVSFPARLGIFQPC